MDFGEFWQHIRYVMRRREEVMDEEEAIPDVLEANAQRLTLFPQPIPKPHLSRFPSQVSTDTPHTPPVSHPFTHRLSRTWLPPGGDAGRAQLRWESSQRLVYGGAAILVPWAELCSTCSSGPSRDGDPGQASSPVTAGFLQH